MKGARIASAFVVLVHGTSPFKLNVYVIPNPGKTNPYFARLTTAPNGAYSPLIVLVAEPPAG